MGTAGNDPSVQEDKHILEGKLLALQYLANEARLECQREGWYMDAAAIKQTQEMLRSLRCMRKEKT